MCYNPKFHRFGRFSCTFPEGLCPASGEAGSCASRSPAPLSPGVSLGAHRRLSRHSRRPNRRSTPSTPRRSRNTCRIRASSTELVDHLPASDTVPTPLKFLGRIVGTPGRADLRQGHPPLLRGARQGVRPRSRCGASARPRKAATWSLLAVADEATIKQLDKYKGDARVADRSAQDDRGAGAAADHDRQADLLDHERHALDRDRRARDADGAAVPARGRGDAVHPDDPQQRHHAHHAGHRSGRPREAGRHLLLQQEARARASSSVCR